MLTILALIVPSTKFGFGEGADIETREAADKAGAQVMFRHFV
jgi:hypothetical protein